MRALNKLSARKVEKLNEVGRYGDGGGLYLQVSNVGDRTTKAWLFRYMLDGRARAMGLGSLDTFRLAEARERARAARQLVADGIDPIERRLQERDARRVEESTRITFKDATTKFLAMHEGQWKNEKHRQQWRNTLASHTDRVLGTRPVSAIDGALITECLAPIWTKTPVTAKRIKQRVDRIIEWVKNGMPLPSPSTARTVRHHKALPYAEVPAFMADLRSRDSISARALEFTILTAARTNETIGARWSEIDLKEKEWTIPATRMKAGKQHRVPLSDRAIEILKTAPREAKSPYVFPGARAGHPLSNMAMLELVRGSLGKGFTVHGFRSTFTDWAHEQTAYPKHAVDMALAHAIGDKVEAAYRRGDLFEKRRRLMSDWSKYCARPTAQANNVTAIGAR